MRLLALVSFALCVIPAFAADDKPVKALTPAEAAKKVNEKVTVEMEVKSTGGMGAFYLNSEKDFRDAKNFTIYIPKEAAAKFVKAKIDKPAEHFKDKKIQVTVRRTADKLSKVEIRVGTFGDQELSVAILDRIKKFLG